MNNLNKKCEECGELLGMSQYIPGKKEGGASSGEKDDLACHNFPKCSMSEKDEFKLIK